MSRAGRSIRTTPTARFELVKIERLHGHERVQPPLLERLTEEIKRDGYMKRPILVADEHLVILDGHHRYESLRVLGCRRIPAFLVDYYSDIVRVTVWPGAVVSEVTKDEVIRRGTAGDRFPPKTTRHIMTIPLEDRPTDLEDLM